MLKINIIASRLLLLPIIKNKIKWYVSSSALIIIRLLILTMSHNPLNHPLTYSRAFMLDMLNSPLITLTIWISALIIISRQNILNRKNKPKLFIFIILTLNLILTLTFSINNIITFYIIFEASLIPTLLLILGWGYQPERLQAGIYLIIYTITASLPLLASLLWIYYENNHLSILISSWSPPTQYSRYVPIWWFITIIAFIVKMPLFITHLWLPKAHVEAPVSGSIILAAILLKLGSYGVIRAAMALTWTNSTDRKSVV